jgi:O-antigen ligase
MNIGGFKTNTFGWAGVVAFVTSIDILTNVNSGKIYNKVLIFASLLAVYLIFISGSRSSYLCLAISILIIIINSNKVRFAYKILISLFIVGISFYMIQNENSAINKRIKKTEAQIEKGESRFTMAETALETMNENPYLLITGFGFDNFREGIFYYKQIRFKLPSHNSYLELFTTTGGISFIFFFVFFILNALVKYIKYDIRKFIYLPPLLIIPFFESNLNAGQYLFFPWMTFLFYYIHSGSTQISIEQLRQEMAQGENKVEEQTEAKYFI